MSETGNRQPSTAVEEKVKYKAITIGKIAVAMALLVAVLALALWFDVRRLRQQTRDIESQLNTTVAALEKSVRERHTEILADEFERDQKLAERQESIEQSMQAIREQLGRDHHEWVVAESDYLLRFANRRLQLERDVRGALIALRSVDGLLAQGADPIYLPVREKLRAEIQSLDAIDQVDVDGIALELSGLSKQLEKLPLATARRDIAGNPVVQDQPVDTEASWLRRFVGAMWSEVKGLVTVRRLNQKVQALLPPEQSYFLVQNLRLRLELARLALLRGERETYQESLKVAGEWLDEYFDRDDTAVKQSRYTITRLAQINIAPALPEIGDSLRALERVYQKQTGRKPAAARQGRQP